MEGHGLVYNPGERFNALSSPLHTLLFLALAFPLGNVELAGTLLSTTFMLLSAFIWMTLVARYVSTFAAFLGGLLFAGTRLFYETYGLETTLFLFLLGLCIFLFQSKRIFLLGIALALLVMTRGEGILLVPALAVEHFRQKRPFPPPTAFIIPLLIVTTFLAFNKIYYGDFFPHTLTVKIGQGQPLRWGHRPSFLQAGYLTPFFIPPNTAWRFVVVGFVLFAVVRTRSSPLTVTYGLFLLLYAAFYILLGIPNYHWYNAPFFLAACLYTGIGMDQAHRIARERLHGRTRIASNVALAGLVLFIVAVDFSHGYRGIRSRSVAGDYREIGLWLRDNTPPDAQVAAVEIGTIGYYSRRPIIDILGLTNPHNAEYIARRRYGKWLDRYSPDFMLVHQPRWLIERSIHRLVDSGRARVRQRFPHHVLYEIFDSPGDADRQLPVPPGPPQSSPTLE